jgi:hypothetical protein
MAQAGLKLTFLMPQLPTFQACVMLSSPLSIINQVSWKPFHHQSSRERGEPTPPIKVYDINAVSMSQEEFLKTITKYLRQATYEKKEAHSAHCVISLTSAQF